MRSRMMPCKDMLSDILPYASIVVLSLESIAQVAKMGNLSISSFFFFSQASTITAKPHQPMQST